jgi:hypothetical protein
MLRQEKQLRKEQLFSTGAKRTGTNFIAGSHLTTGNQARQRQHRPPHEMFSAVAKGQKSSAIQRIRDPSAGIFSKYFLRLA